MELFISGTLQEAKGRNAESRSVSMTQNGELGRPDADRRNLDGRSSLRLFAVGGGRRQSSVRIRRQSCRFSVAAGRLQKRSQQQSGLSGTLARRVTGVKWGSGKNLARLAREVERLAVNRVSSR